MAKTRDSRSAVKTTIVGGQPPGNSRDLDTVPVGLEELLGMAAVREEFAAALLAEPDAALAASGVDLTDTERAVLGALDGPQLEPMIDQVRQRLPEPDRRAFLEQAAAAVAVLVGGVAAVGATLSTAGCSKGASERRGRKPVPREAADTGARPDRPPARADAGAGAGAGVKEKEKEKGRPRPGLRELRPTRGIRPRRPRGKELRKTTGINPDRPRRRRH